jgi:anthranilate phosphoribosyltransferase
MEALGVDVEASPDIVARCVDELGFGFCFARRFHPAMSAVAPVRKALGRRTLFNLIGPLANPAPLTYQLVGVAHASLLRPVAEALGRLGVRHGMVVHGRDGMDEVSTLQPTDVLEVRDGVITAWCLNPAQVGCASATAEALRGGTAAQNAVLARELLAGGAPQLRDVVVLNGGCAVYVADQARTIQEGVTRAREALTSGRVATLLEQVRAYSHAG